MVIEKGEKVHLIMRRLFETDLRRHFIGEVLQVSGDLVRAKGYVFVLDRVTNQYIRRPEKRIRLIGLSDPLNIINVLPPNADVEEAIYTRSKDGKLIVTDGEAFSLDINEFGATL